MDSDYRAAIPGRKPPGYFSVILISTIIALATNVLWSQYGQELLSTRHATAGPVKATEATIPELKGVPQAAAQELLRGRGFKTTIGAPEASADIASGAVVSQSPAAGTLSPTDSTVEIRLSSGPDLLRVPQLVELSRQEAEAKLAALGLKSSTRFVDEGAAGKVLKTEPLAGDEIERENEVVLIVGNEKIEVPKVTGLVRRKAELALVEAGLKVGKIRWRYDEDRAEYTVSSQSPKAGEKVDKGTLVDLTIVD